MLIWKTITVASLLSLASAQATVYLIRHGEKPSDGSNGLTAQGKERAQCLRNVFGGARERPYETVEPLAQDLGLTVDISCDRDDESCVNDAVDDYDGPRNILICWEHDELTKIAKALGDKNAPDYPDERWATR
ncbi:hypothetical protein LTR78_006696 [Recurvomyces mirabilis]|uniref:Phosphoglycerate mutase family protein n=1 Tax=Recurvomyces mirabilis TaxID=574656 RepID=A0AAE1BZQ9_9PEZI|nr:hypothetical protein LTR78_006696 [Recurvomyces mirabilis]KAK5151414.1 hypothetical protein LTS14_009257 [Recurvomyces mirabilis]